MDQVSNPANHIARESYTYIKTPSYITYALQNALEQSWHLTSVFRREQEDSPLAHVYKQDVSHIHSIPDSYRDLIHIAPVLCAEPTTFFYFLVQASVEQLSHSVKTLQQDDGNPQKSPTQVQHGNDSDEIFKKVGYTGWKEIIWMFEGLPSTLQYWSWLGSNSNTAQYWATGWVLSVGLLMYLSFHKRAETLPFQKDTGHLIDGICRQYKAQLDEVDVFMRGRDGTQT